MYICSDTIDEVSNTYLSNDTQEDKLRVQNHIKLSRLPFLLPHIKNLASYNVPSRLLCLEWLGHNLCRARGGSRIFRGEG